MGVSYLHPRRGVDREIVGNAFLKIPVPEPCDHCGVVCAQLHGREKDFFLLPERRFGKFLAQSLVCRDSAGNSDKPRFRHSRGS